MMLVSKDLKKCLALMTLGATLMTGCTSGPGTGFTRFWPKKDNDTAAVQDEELAAKWRARINARSEAEIVAQRDQAAEKPEAESREKSRLGFLHLPWNKDKQAEPQTSEDVQKLEERLAKLEAEKRLLLQNRKLEESSLNLTKRGSMEDPFLKAEQQNQSNNPFDVYARTNPAAISRSPIPPATGDPKWAQQPSPSADRPQAPVITSANPSATKNQFAPGFDQSMKNLGTEVAQESANQAAETNQSTAGTAAPFPSELLNSAARQTTPAMTEQHIASRSNVPDQDATALLPQLPDFPDVQPKLDQPIADEEAPQHPLANLKTAAEQRHDWATLEVQQLMKHARIQARANQFKDAMQTVLAAEQLANNANLKFAANEQTPAELIMILKYHLERLESGSAVAANAPTETTPAGVAQVTVPAQPRTEANLPNWPHGIKVQPAASNAVASAPTANVNPAAKNPSAQPESAASPVTHLPQWPAPHVSLIASEEPQGRYIEARPGTSTTHARTQLITSGSIYSSENLRWAKLESDRATLKESSDQQIPSDHLNSQTGPPASSGEDDPFADAFGSPDAEEEALIEEVPAALLAPDIPAEGEPMLSAWDDEVFGIPVRRIALLALAGLILLAAIIHRRRNNPEQV